MPRVLFIQHGPLDHPGLFADALAEQGIDLITLHPWRGEALPDSLERYAGLGLSGGEQSAYETERHPYFQREMELIRFARDQRLPTLGMCLGAQLMAAALGASVAPGQVKELGFLPVELLPAAARDPLWRDLPPTFTPAHWHGDVFTLPEGATNLARSQDTEHQAFVIDGVLYAFQFHLEMTAPILIENIQADPSYIASAGVDPDRLVRESPAAFAAVEELARLVFRRWVALLRREAPTSDALPVHNALLT